MFNICTIDNQKYIVDMSSVLTSNPPKYNAINMETKERVYLYCHNVYVDRPATANEKKEFYASKT